MSNDLKGIMAGALTNLATTAWWSDYYNLANSQHCTYIMLRTVRDTVRANACA